MNINAVNSFSFGKSLLRGIGYREEKKEKGQALTPEDDFPFSFEEDAPQIWFDDTIGPSGRKMMGSKIIGYSDVINEDGTRTPIFDVKC